MSYRRISIFAILFILLLRTAIGWQLFYEGVWKLKTQSTPRPWTSAGYLANSTGPLRDSFRKLAGNSDGFDWLDAKKMTKRWSDWERRFAKHYALDDKQKSRLHNLVQGPERFASDTGKLTAIPGGVNLDAIGVIKFDENKKRLEVEGKRHLAPKEYDRLVKMVGDKDEPAAKVYLEELSKVYKRSSRLSYVEQMRASLLGDSDVAGMKMKDGNMQQIGELQKYRDMVDDYEAARADARQDFQHEHVQKLWSDLNALKSQLVGPIRGLEESMKVDAQSMLTVEQLQKGKLSEPWTRIRISDMLTIAGLTILGFCLMSGLLTRVSAVLAAIMVFSFYMAMPPLPGLPEQPGPEHSLIVNKNLIEVFALLAIAAFPSGYWFGLDAVFGKWTRQLFGRSRSEDDDDD